MPNSDSPNTEDRDTVLDTAIDWVVRVEARDVSDDDLNAFGDWLAADPGHRSAYAEADRLWHALGRSVDRAGLEAYRNNAKTPDLIAAAPAAGPRWDIGRGALAACSLMVVLLVCFVLLYAGAPEPETPVRLSLAGGSSEIKQFTLDDGTRITLGAGSSASAELSNTGRSVVLHQGEAFFDVVSDVGRPFTVTVGALNIRVTGTAFDVQRKGPVTVVAVAEGQVRLSNPRTLQTASNSGTALAQPPRISQTLTLNAGEHVLAARDDGFREVLAIKPENIGAWRDSRLVYTNVPLEAIIADLDRYDARSITIEESEAAAVTLSATFDNRDIDSVITSLTELLPLELEQTPDNGLVLRSRR
ncbi:MAG: FecR domain-containing protein [Pseudomonadota bacterium]